MTGRNRTTDAVPSSEQLIDVGKRAGLVAVGVTSADVLQPARELLHRRKAAGLAANMEFTYRNPDRSTDPRAHLPSAQSLVAGAWSYRDAHGSTGGEKVEQPVDFSPAAGGGEARGRVARYVWQDHYAQLRTALGAIAQVLKDAGFRATVLADTNHLVDRNAAWSAGLGWYGKNANLLIPGEGSWVVLGAVLTSAELEPTGPPVVDGCGPCRSCIDGCPTGAIVGPGIVDARRCLAWLVQAPGTFPHQWREALGDRIYGCDDCQEVCPPNRSGATGSSAGPAIDPMAVSVSLEWLLTASDEDIVQKHGSWYIANRDVDFLRRSALIALGNSGEPGRSEVRALIERYVKHRNPLLRAHAVWAGRRLGLGELVAIAADDPDPQVRLEMELPVRARFDGPPISVVEIR